MTESEREVMRMALNFIQPPEYGHCLCGHGEYCSYCSPNPARSNIAKALREVLAQPEMDAVLAEREACAQVCDAVLNEDGNWTPIGYRFAAAIRARGQE